MTASHVRRLTLRAADEAGVRAGTVVVEDALRIATLPHQRDPRLYLVRRFDLGRFAVGAGSHALARDIERRVAELVWTAVPAASEQAGDAAAVWFADEVAAIVALARRLAGGPPPSEWYWRHVARGAAVAAPGHALRSCVVAAAQTAPGAVAVAMVVDAIERVHPGALLGDLQPAEAAWLVAVTFGTTFSLAEAGDGAVSAAGLAPAWAHRLATWAPRWRGDARAIWLAAIGAIATRGAIGSVDVEIAEAQQRVAAVLRAPAAPSAPRPIARGEPVSEVAARAPDAPAVVVPETVSAVTSDAPAVERVAPIAALDAALATADRDAPAAPRDVTRSAGASPRARSAAIARAVDRASPTRARAVDEPGALPVEAADDATGGEPTAVGGVLFLLRPLAMLGIAEWLDEHRWAADAGFAMHLLAAIAAAHAPPGDPLVRLAAGRPPDGPFAAPASWRALIGHRPLQLRPSRGGRVLESSGRLPIAAWTGRRPPGAAAFVDRPRRARRSRPSVQRGAPIAPAPWALLAWRRALERWSRRFAQLRCADIVRRPGTLIATPTHLDLRMALADADVRVRLAGLDVDPGWVPWLGRIVAFHYA